MNITNATKNFIPKTIGTTLLSAAISSLATMGGITFAKIYQKNKEIKKRATIKIINPLWRMLVRNYTDDNTISLSKDKNRKNNQKPKNVAISRFFRVRIGEINWARWDSNPRPKD